jgi:hypothetical protein
LLSNTVYIVKLVGLIIGEVVIMPIAVGLLIDIVVLKNLGFTISERIVYLKSNPFSYFALRGTIGGMFIAHLSAILSAMRDCFIPSVSQALLIDPDILSIVQRPDQRPYVSEATRSSLSLIMRVVVNLIAIVPAVLFMVMIPARLGHLLLLETGSITLLNELPDFRTGIPIDMALLHIFTAVLNPKYFAVLERFVRRMLVLLCERTGVAEYVLQDNATRRYQEHQERQLREIEEIERLINVFAAAAAQEQQRPSEAEGIGVEGSAVESGHTEVPSADRDDVTTGESTASSRETETRATSSSHGEEASMAVNIDTVGEEHEVEEDMESKCDAVPDLVSGQHGAIGAEVDPDDNNAHRVFQSVAEELSEHIELEEDEILGEPDVPQPLAARLVATALLFLMSISLASAASVVYPMALGRYLIAAAG